MKNFKVKLVLGFILDSEILPSVTLNHVEEVFYHDVVGITHDCDGDGSITVLHMADGRTASYHSDRIAYILFKEND